VAYVGPGDVVTASAWWGLRAYSAASAGTKAIRVRRSSDDAEQDIFTSATTGDLDIAAATTFAGGSNLFLTTAYDQLGNAIHEIGQHGSNSAQPQLFLSGGISSGKPYVAFSGTQWIENGGSMGTAASPSSISSIAMRTGNFTTRSGIMSTYDGNNVSILAFDTTANQLQLNAFVLAGVSDNAWQYIQATCNGTSSFLNVNGVDNSGNQGSPVGFGAQAAVGAVVAGSGDLIGRWVEGGRWDNIVFTSPQRADLYANQHDYWTGVATPPATGSGFTRFGPFLTTAAAGYGLELVRALGRNPQTTRRGMLFPRNWRR
jgi:hypothetical protein